MLISRRRAAFGTGVLVIFVTVAWRWVTGPTQFVATAAFTYLSVWLVWAMWSSEPLRELVLQFSVVHVVLLLLLGLLELPVLLGAVDYRLVLGTRILAPTRDPRYLPDPELLYLPRPGDRRTGTGARSDITASFHVPDPETYDYDVSYDDRGFRNPTTPSRADVSVVGDSFVVNHFVPAGELLTAVLARSLDATVDNLGHAGYGPQQELAVVRRYALPIRPRVVVWIFFEGNDLGNIYAYRAFVSDFTAARAARHGFAARSFTRNAMEQLMYLAGNPRPSAVPRSAWWTSAGRKERLYFLYTSGRLSEQAQAALRDLESILAEAATLSDRAGARFVLAFAPDKFRACRRSLTFEPDAETAQWTVNDLPERIAVMAARLPGRVTYLDLTPALAARCDAGQLPYFREDSHWNAVGNRIVAEELARTLRPFLAGAGSSRGARTPDVQR